MEVAPMQLPPSTLYPLPLILYHETLPTRPTRTALAGRHCSCRLLLDPLPSALGQYTLSL